MNASKHVWAVLGLLLCLFCSIDAAHSSDSWQTLDRRLGQAFIAGHDVSALLSEATARQAEAPHSPVMRSAIPTLVHRSEAQLATVLTALSSGNPDSTRLAAIAGAYQPVQAAYLLLQDNLTTTRQTLDQHHLPAAYLALADQTQERARRQREALAQALAPCVTTPIETSACISHLASALTLLHPAESALAPILRTSTLPFHPAATAPQTPVALPAIIPAYEQGSTAAPQLTDSANSSDAPLSQAVLRKAAELEHDYVRLYEYVHNSIQTDWYAGAARQPDDLLTGLRGNDVDQASLLIALYRASGVPARYVHGLIEQPVTDVMASLGLSSRNQVGQALTRAGIAFTPIIQGGQLTAVQLAHTWVEVYVPYTNYRGTTVDRAGSAWLPLMPAIKAYDSEAPTDLMAAAHLSADSLSADYLSSVQTITPLELLRQKLQHHLSLNASTKSYDQLRGFVRPQIQNFDLLPSSLPAKVISVYSEAALLADSWQQQVEFNVQTADHTRLFHYQTPARRVTNQRITLSWLPASVDDLRITRLYGGIDLVPLNLIKVRAQLKVNGVVVAYGPEATIPGERHQLQIRLTSPGGSDTVDHDILSGGTDAIALHLPEPATTADPVTAPDDNDTEAARILARLAHSYAQSWTVAEAELADLLQVALIYPRPSISIVGNSYTVESLFDQPHHLLWQGVALDAVSHTVSAVSRGGADRSRDWMRLASLEGSAQEQRILAHLLLVDAVSADKGLALAQEQQVPLHTLSRNNAAELGQLTHSAAVKADIQGWLNQGYTVTVPETVISNNSWTGSVWRVEDPQSGAAGYFISGGLAGGQSTTHPADWILTWLRDALMAAGLLQKSGSADIAAIEKISTGDWQIATVGKPLDNDLSVRVFNKEGEPVQDADVTFVATEGDGHFNDGSQQLVVKSNIFGIASVKFRVGTNTRIRPTYLYLNPGDASATQVAVNLIDAYVEMPSRRLAIEPFRAVGKPDKPAHLGGLSGGSSVYTQMFPGDRLKGIGQLLVTDQFDNPVANVSVSVSAAAPSYSCQGIDGSALNLTVIGDSTKTTGQLGTVDFAVRLGNVVLTTYTLMASADNLQYKMLFRTRGDGCGGDIPPLSVLGLYVYRAWNHVYLGTDITANIAKPGNRVDLPVYYEAQLLEPNLKVGEYGRCVTTPVINVVDLVFTNPQFTLTNGGSLVTTRVVGNTLEAYFRTGPLPGANVISIPDFSLKADNATFPDGFTCGTRVGPINRRMPPFNDNNLVVGVLPVVTGVVSMDNKALPLIPLEGIAPDLHMKAPAKLLYRVEPSAYIPAISYVTYEDNGTVFGRGMGQQKGDISNALLLPEYSFNPLHRYTATVHIPFATSADTIASEPYKLPLDIPLFANVTSQVHVKADVDIVNHDACLSGAWVGFTLQEDAEVSITFNPRNTDDANGQTGSASIEFLHQVKLTAGNYSYPVSIHDLPPGRYSMVIEGKRDRDNSVETYKPYGRAVSEYTVTNRLPVGHPIVKGVDVFDGAFSLGSTDMSFPGRMPLNFKRQYQNHSSVLPDVLGVGWTHNFDSKVTIDPCGFVTVQGGDGGGARFIAQADGSFTPQKGYHGQLVASNNEFDYYTVDGTQYHYRNYEWTGIYPVWVLTYIKDTNNNTITLGYDPHPLNYPKLLAVQRGNDILSFTYVDTEFKVMKDLEDAEGHIVPTETKLKRPVITDISGPDGTSMHFDYDSDGRLITAKRDGSARTESYTYEEPMQANGMTSYTNPNGHVTHITNDMTTAEWSLTEKTDNDHPRIFKVIPPLRVVTRIDEPDAAPTSFVYDFAGHTTTTSDNTYTMNEYGMPLSQTGSEGAISMQWDTEQVLMTRRQDANGEPTTYRYDEDGNVIQETTGGFNRTYTYVKPGHIRNRVSSQTDRNNQKTQFTYDSAGNLTKMTNAMGGLTSYTNSSQGDRTQMIDPNGNITSYRYDNKGNVDGITEPGGRSIPTPRDKRGRATGGLAGNNVVSTYTLDTLDNITVMRMAGAGKSFTYDKLGNRTSETDENGIVTTYHYDAQNRLTSMTRGGATKSFQYDGHGNKINESDWKGQLTTYQYDNLNHLSSRSEPMGKATSYQHDGNGNLLKETDANSNITRYRYDQLNRLVEKTEPLGKVTSYSYDGENKTGETNALGQKTAYLYDKINRLTSQVEPLGKTTTYGYDAVGNLTLEVDANGGKHSYSYDKMNRKERSIDAMGGLTQYQYDLNGNLTLVVDPVGNKTSQGYNGLNQRTSMTDATGAHWGWSYDGLGNPTVENRPTNTINHRYDEFSRLLSSSDDLGQVVTHSYDHNGNLTSQQDANGNLTHYSYDALNRQTDMQAPLGKSVQNGYDKLGNLTSTTNARGATTHYTYDALNRVTGQQDAAGTISMSYDVLGNKTSETDRNTNATTYLYDDLNRMTSETDSIGSQNYRYDLLNNRTGYTDRRNLKSVYTYDKENRLLSDTRSGVPLARHSYDAAGRRTSTTDANNNITTWQYDGLARVISENRPEASVTGYQYDKIGNLTTSYLPEGEVLSKTYDARNRMLSDTDGNGAMTRYSYDGNGNRLSRVLPGGTSTGYTYDQLDRLSGVSDPGGNATYEYDTTDNRTVMINGKGASTGYDYDLANRLTGTHLPGGGNESYAYDGNGNRTTLTDANGHLFTYTYDALDRLLTDGLASYTYDPNGNQTSVVSDAGTERRALYDALDRLSSETDIHGQSLSYGYYPNGVRQSRHSNGASIAYGIDGLNRVTSIQQGQSATSYSYDREGRLLQITSPNGSTSQSVDGVGRILTQQQQVNGGQLSYALFTYDSVGNLLNSTVNDEAGQHNHVYQYDSANRLTDETHSLPETRIHYSYDAVGNRLTSQSWVGTTPATSRQYSYNLRNQLTQETDLLHPGASITYSYDGNGNQLSKVDSGLHTRWTYSYNIRDQLSRVEEHGPTGPPELLATYLYDANGLRTDKVAGNGEHTGYVWDGSSLTNLLNGSNQVIQQYQYGPNGLNRLLTSRKDNPSVTESLWYYLDTLGSVKHLVNDSGAIEARYDYDGYGNVQASSGPATELDYAFLANFFGFTGHILDAETGLLYARARYYDPADGRFISEDSWLGDVKNPPSLHRYLYAYDNPLVYVDPTGHFVEEIKGYSTGVGKGVWNIAKESALTVYDFGQVSVAATKTAVTGDLYEVEYQSGLGQSLAQNGRAGTARAMGKSIIQTPGRIGQAVQDGNYEHLGEEVFNGILLADGGVNLAKAVPKLGQNAAKVVKNVVNKGQTLLKEVKTKKSGISQEGTQNELQVQPESTESTAATSSPTHEGAKRDVACEGSTCDLPGQCFVAGTPVHTEQGLKPIEQVRVGDLVESRDEHTKTTAWKSVLQVFVNHNKAILNITLADDRQQTETLGVTLNHPFYVQERGWVDASHLQAGDRIVSADGRALVVSSIVPDAQPQTTYNFEVADTHSYFVGKTGAWVHNTGGECPGTNGGTLDRGNINNNIAGGVPDGYAGHHMISVKIADKYPAMLDAADVGYDINRGTNGIALPTTRAESIASGLPLHKGRHLSARHKGSADAFVHRELDILQSKYEQGLVSKSQLTQEVGRIEDKIRSALVSNKIRLQRKDPHWK